MIPKKVDCILIDLSGTLLIDNQPTKNAVEALKKYLVLHIFYNIGTNYMK